MLERRQRRDPRQTEHRTAPGPVIAVADAALLEGRQCDDARPYCGLSLDPHDAAAYMRSPQCVPQRQPWVRDGAPHGAAGRALRTSTSQGVLAQDCIKVVRLVILLGHRVVR